MVYTSQHQDFKHYSVLSPIDQTSHGESVLPKICLGFSYQECVGYLFVFLMVRSQPSRHTGLIENHYYSVIDSETFCWDHSLKLGMEKSS
jgi:hypothetical protein